MIRESRKSRVTTRKALPSGRVTDFAGRALLVRGRDVREPRREREPPRCAVPSSELLAREASTPCPECDGSAPLLASMLRDVFIRPSRQATRSLSGNCFQGPTKDPGPRARPYNVPRDNWARPFSRVAPGVLEGGSRALSQG